MKKEEKESLHPRNRHRTRYDFQSLITCYPELEKFVFINKYNSETIDFANPNAVKILNKALLKQFYNVTNWDIPANYLCPPIPGRADYIHYMADLLASSSDGSIPKGKNIHCLDIGVGANCVYPIIGSFEYNWSFVGSDIDAVAINSAKKIVDTNSNLNNIELANKILLNTFLKELSNRMNYLI
jgi:23S rRNA (adenine1618-N6)-methyltransferase